VACASPQKNFRKGNYEKAFSGTLKNLEKGGSDRKDKQILNKSFNELLKRYKNENSDLAQTNHIEDWEDSFVAADELIAKYNSASRFLDSDFDTPLESIILDNEELGSQIADNYFELANMSMGDFNASGDKLAAQDAFLMYEKVKYYDRKLQYADINNLLEGALEAGTIIVIVDADTWELSYGWDVDRRFDDVERIRAGNFYAVYFEENIDNSDCFLEVDFGSLNIRESEGSSTERFTERIVDGYETVTDSSGTTRNPIYKNVSGTVTILRQEVLYEWDARVRTRSYTDYCDFRNNSFDSRITDRRERYQISGDERAIPDRYKTNGTDFNFSESEVVDDLIDDIYNQFIRYYF